jgi:GAF domain-containing protein
MALSKTLPSAAVVNHFQDLVLKTHDVQVLLDELVKFTAVTLIDPAVAFRSVTLVQQQKPVTVARSDEKAVRLDESQYQAGDGPCLTAIRERVPVHIPDIHDDHRWPDYLAAARSERVRSSLSVPLMLEGEAEAGLNLYASRSQGFTSEDTAIVESYVLRASKSLRLAARISQLAEAKDQLASDLESRTAINLAAGAFMAQNRCDHATAMKVMNIAASSRGLTLADIAATVIAAIATDTSITTHFGYLQRG